MDFICEKRLIEGPWQSFERDVARLLLYNNFVDVRLIGGAGDKGADVLGVKDGKLWVFQCKYTSKSVPPIIALREVIDDGKYYKADRLAL